MQNKLKFLVDTFSSNPKNLFLVDSIGAFLSTVLLFIIIFFFEQEFGLPKEALYLFLGIACLSTIYSIYCFHYIDKQPRIFLRIIAISNLLYCLLMVLFLLVFFNSVTTIGYLYFFFEIIIVSFLAYIELKTVNNIEDFMNKKSANGVITKVSCCPQGST